MFTFKDLNISPGDLIVRKSREQDEYYLVWSIDMTAGPLNSGCQVRVFALTFNKGKIHSFYWETPEFARKIFALRSKNLPHLELLRLHDS